MGVSPVSNIYKSLTFGGNNSRDYGVYITGSGVFNSPERDGEMLVIPGRNGAFWQDNGRFQNIEVTYPAGCFGNTAADFAEAVSDFRNMLCSQNGYVRLTDDYHPDEYRMAVYKSGLEVTPATLNAGEFNITFECKPQRFLTSGEQDVTITGSSYTLTNPTLFESKPLIKLYGTGEFTLNGEMIKIADVPTYGRTELHIEPEQADNYDKIGNVTNPDVYNEWDEVTINTDKTAAGGEDWFFAQGIQTDGRPLRGARVVSADNACRVSAYASPGSTIAIFAVKLDGRYISLSSGQGSSESKVFSFTGGVQPLQGGAELTFICEMTLVWRWVLNRFEFTRTLTTIPSPWEAWDPHVHWDTSTASVDSTKPIGANPAYVDLETGEAYEVVNGEIYPVTGSIILPAQLPALKPGANAITMTGFTKAEIVPRWWRV